ALAQRLDPFRTGSRQTQPAPARRTPQRDDSATARLRRLVAASAPRNWFAAPRGQPSNPGTRESPWDIESALTNRTKIRAGDTLWLRGGTYRHPNRSAGSKGYVVNLQGKAGKPVTVRAYGSERVTIDG